MSLDITRLNFLSHALSAALTVSDEELAKLPDGRPCPDGVHLTQVYLSRELKVLWALFWRENTKYLDLVAQYQQLGPADAKAGLFAKVQRAQLCAQTLFDLFWSSVLWEHCQLCAGHSTIGFGPGFRIWVSASLRTHIPLHGMNQNPSEYNVY